MSTKLTRSSDSIHLTLMNDGPHKESDPKPQTKMKTPHLLINIIAISLFILLFTVGCDQMITHAATQLHYDPNHLSPQQIDFILNKTNYDVWIVIPAACLLLLTVLINASFQEIAEDIKAITQNTAKTLPKPLRKAFLFSCLFFPFIIYPILLSVLIGLFIGACIIELFKFLLTGTISQIIMVIKAIKQAYHNINSSH